jgi:DNA-binding response OmpR family regulator
VVSVACPHCGGVVPPATVFVDLDRNMIVFGWGDTPVALSPFETVLAHLLVKSSPGVVPVDVMIRALWGHAEPEYADPTVRIYIGRLRKKISCYGVSIQTTRLRGYWFSVNPTKEASANVS